MIHDDNLLGFVRDIHQATIDRLPVQVRIPIYRTLPATASVGDLAACGNHIHIWIGLPFNGWVQAGEREFLWPKSGSGPMKKRKQRPIGIYFPATVQRPAMRIDGPVVDVLPETAAPADLVTFEGELWIWTPAGRWERYSPVRESHQVFGEIGR